MPFPDCINLGRWLAFGTFQSIWRRVTVTEHKANTEIKPPLRIAYLTEWAPYAETGVLRKLIGQVRAWRELGCEASLFSLAALQARKPALDFEEFGSVVGTFHQKQLDRYPKARLGYLNKIATVPRLLARIKAFQPDVIYYRQQGPWYPGLSRLLSVAPTILEINADEDAENKLWNRFFASFHRITRTRTHRRLAGFVCVTHEIARKYEHSGKPVAVIPNSMWGAPQRLPVTGNTTPSFVFVGSPMNIDVNWHGVDKLLPLAKAFPDCLFHIVGPGKHEFCQGELPANILVHGEQSSDGLIEVFRQSDVGLGTLALHRESAQEACSLKVRDYLMHGLPVVIGYTETETGLHGADYVLQIDNTEDNITSNMDRIAAFARRWCGKRVTADLSFMASTAIERRRLDFISCVAR